MELVNNMKKRLGALIALFVFVIILIIGFILGKFFAYHINDAKYSTFKLFMSIENSEIRLLNK